MANLKKRLSTNVDGDFFVDSTCIDCDTCRQLAPETFADSGDFSYVYAQPQSPETLRKATQAMLACPTGSIGTVGKNITREVIHDFPVHLENGVYYAGFNSPKSYGGHSYFIQHKDGNWLIDSPRFMPHLTKKFEELGGIKYIFLTHRDDVAEAASYANKFGSQRIIHQQELSAQPDAEIVLEGNQPIEFFNDFLIVPTPGHTRGHCVLLYQNRFLFAGDHLWWSRVKNTLSASSEFCWYSFKEQAKSMTRLQNYSFDWVLPGHGQRIQLAPEAMQTELTKLVEWMQQARA